MPFVPQFIVIIFLLCIPSLGLAQTKNQAKPKLSTQADNQIVGMGLNLGLVIPLVPAYGVDLFLPVSKRYQMGVHYLAGKGRRIKGGNKSPGTETTVTDDIKQIATHLRIFFYEGTNFNISLARKSLKRRTKIVYDDFLGHKDGSSSKTTTHDEEETKLTTTLGLSFGYTWLFASGFFVGGDWLAIQHPLGKGSSTGLVGMLNTGWIF